MNLFNDYTYDSANRLVSVTKGETISQYTYNGLGDRIQQIVNGITTDYVLDINTGLTQVLQDGTNTYLYGINRVAQSTAAQTEFFLADALGSVRNLTDSSGGVRLTQSYTPFGEILESFGDGQTDYAYTGEMYDPNTGLVFLRARYYNPSVGRFTSRDVWDGDNIMPMSYNAWLYVNGNPIMYTDPTGYCTGDPNDANNPDKSCWELRTTMQKTYANVSLSRAFALPELKVIEGALIKVEKAFNVFGKTILNEIGQINFFVGSNSAGMALPHPSNSVYLGKGVLEWTAIHEIGHRYDFEGGGRKSDEFIRAFDIGRCNGCAGVLGCIAGGKFATDYSYYKSTYVFYNVVQSISFQYTYPNVPIGYDPSGDTTDYGHIASIDDFAESFVAWVYIHNNISNPKIGEIGPERIAILNKLFQPTRPVKGKNNLPQ